MIKPEDIIQVEFSRAVLGYDMKEVDTLLDAVIEQMEAWEKERSEMLTALEYLLREIERYEMPAGQKSLAQVQAASVSDAARSKASVSSAVQTEALHAKRSRSDSRKQGRRVAAPHFESKHREASENRQTEQERQTVCSDDFEIPTYVFAGTQDAATQTLAAAFGKPQSEQEHTEGNQTPVPVSEEIEIAQAAPQQAGYEVPAPSEDVRIDPTAPAMEEAQA